jgi:hypothetical protein
LTPELPSVTQSVAERFATAAVSALDVRGFFDNVSHEWLVKFVEHRIADRRLIRLIQKWLKAGVSEEGEWKETKVGTPQGAVASPLHPVHLPPPQAHCQCVQPVVLAAPRPEPVGESQKVLFVDLIENRHHGLLNYLVLQRGDP